MNFCALNLRTIAYDYFPFNSTPSDAWLSKIRPVMVPILFVH
jgi:hypothetical protein